MQQGKVKFFNKNKGFGFIIANDDKKEYFVHINNCAKGFTPEENDEVEFELIEGKKGPQCSNVNLPE